jgi:anti-sigma B factor antagonist
VTVEPIDVPGGARILAAAGELDIAVVPALLSRVADLVAGATGVVLDLSDVSFFDSSGVRLVDRIGRECRRASTPFRVVAPPHSSPRRVLDIVGMTGPLVDDDRPTAVASVLAAPRA